VADIIEGDKIAVFSQAAGQAEITPTTVRAKGDIHV
jgi:hypothetical protein